MSFFTGAGKSYLPEGKLCSPKQISHIIHTVLQKLSMTRIILVADGYSSLYITEYLLCYHEMLEERFCVKACVMCNPDFKQFNKEMAIDCLTGNDVSLRLTVDFSVFSLSFFHQNKIVIYFTSTYQKTCTYSQSWKPSNPSFWREDGRKEFHCKYNSTTQNKDSSKSKYLDKIENNIKQLQILEYIIRIRNLSFTHALLDIKGQEIRSRLLIPMCFQMKSCNMIHSYSNKLHGYTNKWRPRNSEKRKLWTAPWPF